MSKNEGFLGSFLSKGLRTNQLELNTDEKTLRPIARLKEPRDLFALPKNKDHEFALQAPRWPIECQVLEERVIHIIDTHARPEPYNTPGGLKPRPVGEENGEVVFNYNPISPVNYDKPKAKFRESSDSDISSSESRNSSPDRGTVHDAPLKAELELKGRTSFTKLISSLNQRSSSNSNDDEEVCEDTEDALVSPDNGSITTPLMSESNSIESNSTNNINDNQKSITSTDASEGMTTQTSDEIDDIWVNNSTEYPPGTPIFTRPLKMDSQQLIELSNLNKTSTESLVLNAATGGGDKKDEDTIRRVDKTTSDDRKEMTDLVPKSGAELVTEPGKKVVTKLETELVIRSITSTVTSTAGGGNDATMTTDSDRNKPNEKDVELRVKTPILNDDVLKLYNDIISVTESNKSDPQNERKTNKIESKSDKESKHDGHVCNERQTKMYLDLNVEEDAYKNARNMFFARNSQDNTKLNTDSSSMSQFSRSNINGSKILTNCHPCTDENYDGLEFESRFESGNLAKAVRITKSYYELYLRPDLYTNRSKQWFYFRVRKTKKDILYRFSIVNLVKSDSLYNEGMRPVMYSTMRARQLREGWRRCGENVCYYRNEDENTTGEEDDDSTYTLTFNIEFPNDDDTVYLAHSYPYTYSDLQDYLMGLQRHPVKSKFCKLRILCRTLAGNNVYYLTVTSPPRGVEEGKSKKSIVISARVHPSETPASWMMKGLMDYITGDTWIAKRLRQKFVFKLIPMLNPDGVIVGNTRNSLTGKDLNRQYRTVIRETYPSIWYTKALVKRLIDECGVAMYCDMHAHSRKQNIFLYGCENKRNPEKKLTEQVFPLMMHKNASDTFSFEGCKFKVQRNKEGTGRIVVWMLGITNSYTIEASFGGSSLGGRRGTHFNTIDYENIGRTFCETLLDYCDDHPNKERLRLKIIERLMKEGSSADEPLNIRLSDYSSDEGHASSDSDSEKKSSIKTSELYELSPDTSPSSTVANVRDKRRRPKLVHKGTRKGNRIKDGTDMPTTDPNSDVLFSTDDELCSNRSNSNSMRLMLMQSDLQRHYIKEIGGSSFFLNHMPPEVIITTPSTSSKFEIISPNSIKNYPQLREGSGLLSMRRTSSWHNLHCAESVRKTKLRNQYQNSQDFSKDDLQLKLPPKTKYWPGVGPESHKWMKNSLPPSFGIPQTTVTNLYSIQSEVKNGNFASTSSHNSAEWDTHEAFFKACSDKILNVNYFSNIMTSSTTSAARASHPPRDKSSRSSFMPDINLEERTLRIFKQVTKFSSEQSENLSSPFHTKSRGLRKKKQRSPPDTTNQILSHLRTLSKAGKSRSNICCTLHRHKSGSTPTQTNPIHVRRSNNQLQQQPSNWTDTSKFKASGIVVRSANMRRCKLHSDNKLLLQQTVPTATAVAMVPKTRLAAHSQLAENPSRRQIPHSVKRKFKAPKNTTIRSLTLVKPGGDAEPTTFAQAAPSTKKSATVAGERVQVKLKKFRDVPQ